MLSFLKMETHKYYNITLSNITVKEVMFLFDWAVFLKIIIAILHAIVQNLPPM